MISWTQFLENIVTTRKDVDYSQIQTVYNKAHIAIDLIKMYEPQIMANIAIVANLASGAYGVYNSSEDNTQGDTIHVNVRRIMNEKKTDIEAVLEIACTIIHETTHEYEYGNHGKSDETGPKQAEAAFMAWVQQNWESIMEHFPELNEPSPYFQQKAPKTAHPYTNTVQVQQP